jgi:hypothetical protein
MKGSDIANSRERSFSVIIYHYCSYAYIERETPWKIVTYSLSVIGDDIGENATFTGAELRKALEGLENVIGRSLTEAVLYDMRVLYGISLEYGGEVSRCTLGGFRHALEDMLGEEAANLIMNKVKKQLLIEHRSNGEREGKSRLSNR